MRKNNIDLLNKALSTNSCYQDTEKNLEYICFEKIRSLMVCEEFLVLKVTGVNKRKYSDEYLSLIQGKISGSISGIYKTICLEVKSLNDDCSVKYLDFEGDLPVFAGQEITAKIPRYEPKLDSGKKIYVDRPFKEKESAIEITIRDSVTKRELRTELSANHDEYF